MIATVLAYLHYLGSRIFLEKSHFLSQIFPKDLKLAW